MTWEQQFHAIKAVSPTASLEMRKPGDWYVNSRMEHAEGNCCLVGDYGNGISPQHAVENHWKLYGNGKPFRTGDGAWLRWNGFMWEKSERPLA